METTTITAELEDEIIYRQSSYYSFIDSYSFLMELTKTTLRVLLIVRLEFILVLQFHPGIRPTVY